MKQLRKKNDTGIRVLEILKMLIKEPISANQLIKEIETRNNIESIYNKDTLLKYFNTLELVGLKIRKKDNKYYLENLPVAIDLTEKEIKVLCLLEGYVKNLYQKRLETTLNELIENLEKSFSKETAFIYQSIKTNNRMKTDIDFLSNAALIRQFEKYCVDSQKLKIEYQSKSNRISETFIVEPKNILYDADVAYILVYNPALAQNQKLILENIKSVSQLPQKANSITNYNSIIFELEGRLAKAYKLKADEKVINHSQNKIIISNYSEDKNVLFKRLLKYGESCKILQPKSAQKEFLNMVDKILINLEKN